MQICYDSIVQTPIPVKLDEHQVPDLQNVRVIHVDKMRGVPTSNAVVVDLTAGATGASVSHLPKVILHAARQYACLINPVTNKTFSNFNNPFHKTNMTISNI